MDRNLRWRSIGLVALLAFCVCTLLPSFVDDMPPWFTSFFGRRLNFGIDIDGGARVVYSIDLDKAIDDKASEIKRDLESKFNEGEWKGKVTLSTPSTPVGAVTAKITDPSKRDEIHKLMVADYTNEVVDRPCAPNDGASAICIRVSADYAEGIRSAALHNAVNTIRDRIDENGVAEPSVIEKGDDIIVELPGLDETAIQHIRGTIARTAKLEFKVVDNNATFMRDLHNFVTSDAEAQKLKIVADTDTWRAEEATTTQHDFFLYAYDRVENMTMEEAKVKKCAIPKEQLKDKRVDCVVHGRDILDQYLKELGAKDPKFKVPDDRQIAFEKVEPQPGSTQKLDYWRTWFLDRAVRLSGSSISRAATNFDPNTGHPLVLVDFNRYGSRIFGDLTSENVGKRMAIILDDKVSSAPTINGAIRGGRASITVGVSDPGRAEIEAKDLANVLQTGSLPAPLREEQASQVGPTLGRDAVDKAKLSFGLGILLVVLIMVGIYRFSGVLAIGAVVINVLMQVTVMALFGATLTLPGIAAVVLTVGMGVDGNILIYERIREELLAGKSVRGAVDAGFSRAFSAILDGHFTTAAAGWVLLQYGTGPIKGFAVMLLVGISANLFTNIWVSRLFFDWYLAPKKGTTATISI